MCMCSYLSTFIAVLRLLLDHRFGSQHSVAITMELVEVVVPDYKVYDFHGSCRDSVS